MHRPICSTVCRAGLQLHDLFHLTTLDSFLLTFQLHLRTFSPPPASMSVTNLKRSDSQISSGTDQDKEAGVRALATAPKLEVIEEVCSRSYKSLNFNDCSVG